MTSDELELWEKIRTFQFDKPNIRLTFAKRLAKEKDISQQFADRIVEEYRKFIFLCCVSPAEVSPSYWVDQAWHLHLTYTKSYWVELCAKTINRDLHHNPTQGGEEEDQKFKNLYQDTLSLYESYFGSTAPAAVWPEKNDTPKSSFAAGKREKRIIPKPNFTFQKHGSLFIIAIILVALLLGCTADVGSVPFILGFVVIIAIVIAIFRKSRQASGDRSSGCSSGGCGGGSDGDSHSHSHDGDSSDGADGGDSGGGDSGCSSGCSGGCGGGGD